jgi:hypothetical protein
MIKNDSIYLQYLKELMINWRCIQKKPIGGCLMLIKNGVHLITTPFNLQQFKEEYQDIDVHKNNPTLLYCL